MYGLKKLKSPQSRTVPFNFLEADYYFERASLQTIDISQRYPTKIEELKAACAWLTAARVLFLAAVSTASEITANIFSNGSRRRFLKYIWPTIRCARCSDVPTICSGQWKSFKLDLASDQFRVDRDPVHVSPLPTALWGWDNPKKKEKKRKRSSWITPLACNQCTGVSRGALLNRYEFFDHFWFTHRFRPVYRIDNIISARLVKKSNRTKLWREWKLVNFPGIDIPFIESGLLCFGVSWLRNIFDGFLEFG